MRRFKLVLMLLAGAAGLLTFTGASWAQDRQFDVPAGDLGVALELYARQAGVQLIYRSDEVANTKTAGVHGSLSVEHALAKLLAGTPFVLQRDPSGAIAIAKQAAQKTSLAVFSQDPPGVDPPDQDATLETIVVTAEKRREDARKVPLSVTAISGGELQSAGAQTFEDYIGTAPGVVFAQSVPQQSNIIMRGIGTATVSLDQNQGTTAILLDDTPLTDPGFALSLPDFDVFDLQRVEVLKGPQGTIFGTAALGGAVNYITNPVSVKDYQADVQASGSGTSNADQTGYTAKGAVNLPVIGGVFGVRLTATDRFDPGYFRNLGLGTKDAGALDQHEYRADLLWQLNDSMSLDLLNFFDYSDTSDLGYGTPSLGFGGFAKSTSIAEPSDYSTQMNRLRFDADLGFATLTSMASYLHKKELGQFDLAPVFADTGYGSNGLTHGEDYEVRLASEPGQPLDWLVGLYHGDHIESAISTEGTLGTAPFYTSTIDYRSIETSGFAQLTYHLSDAWKIAAGTRYYDIAYRTSTDNDIFGSSSLSGGVDHNSGFSPNGSVTFEPNGHLLIYGLISSGFREGGVNVVPPLAGFNTPATYKPDNLVNYELGLRTTWLGNRLTFDVTPYYVDWNHIQIRLFRPDSFSYEANAASARTYGVENKLQWKPTANFQMQASVTYLNAALSATTNEGNGTILPAGQALPGSAPWTSFESATYGFSLPWAPYVTVSHQYVGQSRDGFLGSPPNPSDALPVGGYNVFDLRVGLHVRQTSIMLFANNIADSKGVTASQLWYSGVQNFYVRPRTIGLVLNWAL